MSSHDSGRTRYIECTLIYVIIYPVQSESMKWLRKPSDLFSHRLRVGDGRAEEPVPLESSVESSPVVVAVAGVRQAPRDDGVELAVHRVARLTLGARAHTAQRAARRATVVTVVVSVTATER